MKRVSVEEALQFAEDHFPHAPEKLAELLQIEVRRSAFTGDGYCLRHGHNTIIRINSSVSLTRQRFTLAHELGHIVHGTSSVVGGSVLQSSTLLSPAENSANEFAGQLLVPLRIVKNAARRLPLSRRWMEKFALRANVSPVFLARRLTTLAPTIGLVKAATFHYEKQVYQWCDPPKTTSLLNPKEVLKDCLQSKGHELQIIVEERVLDAMLISNPGRDSQTVFIQVTPIVDHTSERWEAKLFELETRMFCNCADLKPSLEGCMSGMKMKVTHLTVSEAVELFNNRYLHPGIKWNVEFRSRLLSPEGQQYLIMRLEPWTQRAED